jgi:hypothetical protein
MRPSAELQPSEAQLFGPQAIFDHLVGAEDHRQSRARLLRPQLAGRSYLWGPERAHPSNCFSWASWSKPRLLDRIVPPLGRLLPLPLGT